MKKLGIENLKVAIVSVINLGEKIEKNLADDGKISLAEALKIGVGSFGGVIKVIKSGNQIKAEVKDLDSSEIYEMRDLIKEELDLENDKIEIVIEKSIDFLVGLEELIAVIK